MLQRNDMVAQRRWCMPGLAMMVVGALIASCSDSPPGSPGGGTLTGQVVVSGALRRAAVSVDQLETSDPAMTVRDHVTDTTTDDDGRFSVDVGSYSGLLLVRATGGSFVDLSTGATIQLDTSNGLASFAVLGLGEQRDDVLVSPIGHLIVTRTRSSTDQFPGAPHPVVLAAQAASEHLNRHFGNVDWTRLKLGSLDVVATSPTEPIRAALVQAALSELAHDIAMAAGASPQDVSVMRLTQQLAADLEVGTFDGNDHNNPSDFTQGLQVGVCGPVASCTIPASGCTVGACRPLCDLYAGTPRALLAGAMTEVIGSSINRTRLSTLDILAVARAMSNNIDDTLFDACIEELDRLPPKLAWIDPTPKPMTYVRGVVAVKVQAVDDTDPMPAVWIDAQAPTARIAEAAIDTTAINGPLAVRATAKDMAGNVATLSLPAVIADNLAPALTLAPTGFLVDPATWWTATTTPVLGGTVTDASPLGVAATTPAGKVNATVSGSTWTASLAGPLDLVGADVTIAATDAAGNHAEVTQHIRADVTPPQLTFQPSIVDDEALEVPAFDGNEAPVHRHTGAAVDLAVAGSCPVVTKFSYLLGAAPPTYGAEVDDRGAQRRNPLHYVLVAADNGVGIAAGSTQYRVGVRTGTATTWLLDWTSAGAARSDVPGVDQYDIGIFSEAIPPLASTEGIYDVELRATDRLARTTTVARCFELHLRAPPLHFQAPGQGDPDPDPIPVGHAYRLASLDLTPGAPFSAIAARLLNNDASGASLIDEDVTNGTASTIYLDVGVTRPATVYAGQSFVLDNVGTTRTANIDCTDDPENPPPALCRGGSGGPVYASPSPADLPINGLSFPVKVFELDASLQPATEVPCLMCGAGDHWKFAIPPRSVDTSGTPHPRRFKVMTLISQISLLWPSDGNFPATPPFSDTSLNGIAFTGRVGAAVDACSAHSIHTLPDGTRIDTCTRITRVTPYRALKATHLRIGGPVSSRYATAPTPMVTPANPLSAAIPSDFTWDCVEGTLP
jgi:hypothetical protein